MKRDELFKVITRLGAPDMAIVKFMQLADWEMTARAGSEWRSWIDVCDYHRLSSALAECDDTEITQEMIGAVLSASADVKQRQEDAFTREVKQIEDIVESEAFFRERLSRITPPPEPDVEITIVGLGIPRPPR